MGKALVHDTDDLAMIPALQLCDPPKAVSPSKENVSIDTNLLLCIAVLMLETAYGLSFMFA